MILMPSLNKSRDWNVQLKLTEIFKYCVIYTPINFNEWQLQSSSTQITPFSRN